MLGIRGLGVVRYCALLKVSPRNLVPPVASNCLPSCSADFTGYLLYCPSCEYTRPVISVSHWILSLVAVPAALVWHILSGPTRARRGETTSEQMENHA
jgi:hypothetical protein